MPHADGVFLKDGPQRLVLEGSVADITFVVGEYDVIALFPIKFSLPLPFRILRRRGNAILALLSEHYVSFLLVSSLIDADLRCLGPTLRSQDTSNPTISLMPPTLPSRNYSSSTLPTPRQDHRLGRAMRTHLLLNSNGLPRSRVTSSSKSRVGSCSTSARAKASRSVRSVSRFPCFDATFHFPLSLAPRAMSTGVLTPCNVYSQRT